LIAFLDACAIIYRVEAVEPYLSKLKRALAQLHRIEQPATIAVSRLSLIECRVKPLRDKDRTTLGLYRSFFTAPGLRIVELDARVVDRATVIRADTHLTTADAIQAASALSLGGALQLFTNDEKFKRVRGLKVVLI